MKTYKSNEFTHKEKEIINSFTGGLISSRSIAKKHHISTRTVETHLDNIKAKVGIYSKEKLLQFLISEKHKSIKLEIAETLYKL